MTRIQRNIVNSARDTLLNSRGFDEVRISNPDSEGTVKIDAWQYGQIINCIPKGTVNLAKRHWSLRVNRNGLQSRSC